MTGDILHAALKLAVIAQNEGVWWGDFEELDSRDSMTEFGAMGEREKNEGQTQV